MNASVRPLDGNINAVAAVTRRNRQAPASMLASHSTEGRIDRTRPLCPYPQVASYRGTGSIDDAASFACAVP